MALVSGRPSSFQMDLYTPLFVPRPMVEPELFASLRPPTYSVELWRNAKNAAEKELEGLSDRPFVREIGGRKQELQQMSRDVARPGKSRELGQSSLNFGNSVNTAATAAKLGDFFQYAIDRPVSLARQKSALLPIVTKEVDASRVSIYNEYTQAKYPLLGLKLKNTSAMHLMQGPIQ